MNQATMLAEDEYARPVEKLHVKIGGMQCSFCVASIDQALTQMDGVNNADVNLAHEEVLVQYEPARVTPTQLKDTLRSLGYHDKAIALVNTDGFYDPLLELFEHFFEEQFARPRTRGFYYVATGPEDALRHLEQAVDGGA